MARLARRPPSPHEESEDEESDSVLQHVQPSSSALSSPPSASFSSDKENRASSSRPQSRGGKRKSDVVEASSTTETRTPLTTNKRRKTVETSEHRQSRRASNTQTTGERNEVGCYDPDQDPDERRTVRKGLRDLTQQLNESTSEYLQSSSTGLRDTLEQANDLFRNVKNTSDATIDSRLLVSAGDISLRKTQQLNLGDASVGIDLDEFVSKCASFMRQSPNNTGQRNEGEEEDDDEGDALDWYFLGRQICFPYNARPALSGFLLGPLSVQKKVRQVSQRRARQEKVDRNNAVRPMELDQEDLDKQETANLTQICKQIEKQLIKIRVDGEDACEREISEDMTDLEALDVMAKHDLSDDGGVPLLNFCVNPHSFGQTVENFFYVSFLIKEGGVGLSHDSRGFPTLHSGDRTDPQEARRQGMQRSQAVWTLDFDTWQETVRTFDIKKSIIPDRHEEEHDDGTGGWYS